MRRIRLRPSHSRFLAVALAACLAAASTAGGDPSSSPQTAGAASDFRPDEATRNLAREIQKEIDVLASDGMEGRGLGTKGIRRAADWIEQQLRKEGLKPVFAGSYRQKFPVKVGVKRLPGNRLEGVPEEGWTPLGFSSSGEFAGELAFAGYGIESPSIGYRELDGLDLKGKVVLILRYEPQEKDDASPFDGKKPSRWSALRYKVLQARERGAAAVVFVTGPLQDEGSDKLPALRNDGPESPAGLPVLQVRTSIAQAWLSRIGIDLKKFQEEVDRDLIPRSRGTTGVVLRGNVALEASYTDTENLAGMIPGTGARASEVVVIGAHYDHLGWGGEHSMKPNVSAIHNGADDNASGSVAVLRIGESLRKSLDGVPDHRTVVLALFSGEEVGLAGSSYFVDHPPFPIARTVAMVNLDMVGRLRDRLVILGSESAPEWRGSIDRARSEVPGLSVTDSGDGYGPSDQTSFYGAGVPVLHLFTGAHEEYHTPEDKPATIDAVGEARVTEFAVALCRNVAAEPTKLTYNRAGAAPTMSGDSRGYGSYLGTIPDYRAMEATEGGVLLADVRKEGPADRAGIRGGDRIVEMAGTRIENLYDMTYALQDHKPGETISVTVIRDSQPVTLRATLGDRSRMTGGEAGQGPGGSPTGKSPHEAAVPSSPAGPPASVAAASPAPPGAPVASAGPATEPKKEEGGVAPFFRNRPGAGFKIGAGKPFEKMFEGERHLKEIRQLTFGGQNAEAYFSPDGKHLIFQSTPAGAACDQEYVLDLETGESRRVSSGKGRTTCGYFDYPEADRIIYSSTEGAGDACPPRPDYSQGYVWAIYAGYDIYEAKPDGSQARKLTDSAGYDAEATWCPRGGTLVFTSVRDGDLDLYSMDEAGETKRLTREMGYDGGAFYSPDCREIVWRASRPQGEDLQKYRDLLAQGLVRPEVMELYIMKADGTGIRQLTANGAANFCPTFTADGTQILYASNTGTQGGREFDLYRIPKSGGEPERITFSPGFDAFPHFSPDGVFLVWASNRADPASHETNLFIARWQE